MAMRLTQSYSALRRGNYAGAASALGIKKAGPAGFNAAYARNQSKAIANGWLELQYGWLPAVGDVYGYAQHLQKMLKGRSPNRMVRVKGSTVESTSEQVRDGNRVTTYEGSSRYDVTVRMRYTRSSHGFTELSALGITNPAAIAWELTKWSFLYDWVVQMGNWINSLDATLGYEFREASMTRFAHYVRTGTITCSGPYAGATIRMESQQASTETVSCTRVPLNAFTVHAILPAIKNPASLRHALNAMALLLTHKR